MPFNNRLSSDKLGKVSSWNLSNTSKLHEGLQHWIRKTHPTKFPKYFMPPFIPPKRTWFCINNAIFISVWRLYFSLLFLYNCREPPEMRLYLRICTLLVIICGRFLYLNVWDSAKLQVCCDSCLLCRVYHYEKLLGT